MKSLITAAIVALSATVAAAGPSDSQMREYAKTCNIHMKEATSIYNNNEWTTDQTYEYWSSFDLTTYGADVTITIRYTDRRRSNGGWSNEQVSTTRIGRCLFESVKPNEYPQPDLIMTDWKSNEDKEGDSLIWEIVHGAQCKEYGNYTSGWENKRGWHNLDSDELEYASNKCTHNELEAYHK